MTKTHGRTDQVLSMCCPGELVLIKEWMTLEAVQSWRPPEVPVPLEVKNSSQRQEWTMIFWQNWAQQEIEVSILPLMAEILKMSSIYLSPDH